MTPSAEIFIVLPKDHGWQHTSTIGQYELSKQATPVITPYMSTLSCRPRSSITVESTGPLPLCRIEHMAKSD
jgi:hypothetical protein